MSRRLLALVASAALLPACANHVRYASDRFDTTAREIVHVETAVLPQNPALATPGIELEIYADETAVVRKLRTNVRVDVYTPYTSGQELWEVPVGVVCLPALLVARSADWMGLGFASHADLEDFTGWTFTALNPLLNLESDSRLRRKEVSRATEELDRDVRRERRPLAGEELSLSLDAHAPHAFTSDAHGRLRVDLLALAPDALPGRPRGLRVSVQGDDERERQVFELPLARALSARLVQAVAARRRARLPGASPERIGRSLVELDALGFSASALALEAELREREGANPAWLARLDSAKRP